MEQQLAARVAPAASRSAIVILGMHRSGTSALTRLVSLLGADLPKDLMPPVPGNNATGFWESLAICDVNDWLLEAAGSAWDDWRRLDIERLPARIQQEAATRALGALRWQFFDADTFVLKDPRICRLLPFWQDVLSMFGAQPRYLLPLRNPLEVAASLRQRDGMPKAAAMLLWLRHVLDAELHSRGHARAVITYAALLDKPTEVLVSAGARLGDDWRSAVDCARPAIDAFLAREHRHFAVDDSTLGDDPEIGGWVRETYELLLMLQGDSESAAILDRLDSLRRAFDQADHAFSSACSAKWADSAQALDGSRRRIDTLEAFIARQEESRSAQARVLKRLQSELTAERAAREACAATTAGAQDQVATQQMMARLAQMQMSGVWQLASRLQALEQKRPRIGRLTLATAKGLGWLLSGRIHERWRLRKDAARIVDNGLFAAAWYMERYPEAVLENQNPLIAWLHSGWRQARDPHPLFDTDWYIGRCPDASADRENPLLHYLRTGAAAGLDPHPLFDTDWYAARCPADMTAGPNPLTHYLRSGAAAGLDPHPLFQSSWYLAQCGDGTAARGEPVVHYMREGFGKGLDPHPLFDVDWYIERYPEAMASGLDPLAYYLETGAAAGHDPNRLFDTDWYVGRYPQVGSSGLNPLVHYVESGAAAGLDPHPLFDTDWYGSTHPEATATGLDPLAYYLHHGAAAGHSPHPLFDADWYSARCADVAASGLDALTHYLQRGAAAGENPHPLFDGHWYLRQADETDATGLNPLLHYVMSGAAAGYAPHPLFDSVRYAARYPDAVESGLDPLSHYLTLGAAAGCDPHPMFHSDWYLARHPEVARVGANPLVHYVQVQGSGVNPSPLFDGAWYVREHAQIASDIDNPLLHFVTRGAALGLDPNPLFNTQRYLEGQGLQQADSERAFRTFIESGSPSAVGAYRDEAALRAAQHAYRSRTSTLLLEDRRQNTKPFALFLQCGAGSRHQDWLQGRCDDWDLVVNHYEPAHLGALPADIEIQQVGEYSGTKTTCLHDLLEQHAGLLERYDYVLLLDDDVVMQPSAISALLYRGRTTRFGSCPGVTVRSVLRQP